MSTSNDSAITHRSNDGRTSYRLGGVELYRPRTNPSDLRIDVKLFKGPAGSSNISHRVIRPGVPVLEHWDAEGVDTYTGCSKDKKLYHWTPDGTGGPDPSDLTQLSSAIQDLDFRFIASQVALEEKMQKEISAYGNIEEASKMHDEWYAITNLKTTITQALVDQWNTVADSCAIHMPIEHNELFPDNGPMIQCKSTSHKELAVRWLKGAHKDLEARHHKARDDVFRFIRRSFTDPDEDEDNYAMFTRIIESELVESIRKETAAKYDWIDLDHMMKRTWGTQGTTVPTTITEVKEFCAA